MPYIEVNDTELYYLDEGPKEAPAIVFSSSMFFDVTMFQAQADAFSKNYRVIRFDHRGQGQSARAPRSKLDMDTLTDDVVAMIEKLGIAPCSFVGNSMGGFIALRLAARRPDLVRSIVALGTSADIEEHTEVMDRVGDAIARDGIAPYVDEVLPFMVGDTTLNDPSRANVLEVARKTLLSRNPDCTHAIWNISHRNSILHELANIVCPVLLVAGTEDNSYPPEKLEQIKERIPHAEIEYMQRTGHVHAVENPKAVIDSLALHLNKLE